MPNKLPKPSDFSQQIDGLTDPRFAEVMQHLKPGVDLRARVEEIFRSVDEVRTVEGAINAEDLAKAAVMPKVTGHDFSRCKIDITEINGHVVYYIQLKGACDPATFPRDVIIPALGGAWEHFKVEGWPEQEPYRPLGLDTWIWGVLIRDLTINAMNRQMFIEAIPKKINELLEPR